MSQLAIVEAFKDLPDHRRTAGQRHANSGLFVVFTRDIAAGNRGLLPIGD